MDRITSETLRATWTFFAILIKTSLIIDFVELVRPGRLRQKVPELFSWKGAEQLYPSLNQLRRFSKFSQPLRVGARGFRGIRNAPVRDRRLAGKNRTGFLRSIAHGDNDIELPFSELPPRLAARVLRIDLVNFPQDLKGVWAHDTGRLTASAVHLEATRADFSGEKLGKNAPGRITGTEKQQLGF